MPTALCNNLEHFWKIVIKNLQLKGYTAIYFLENSEPKTGQEHKFWQFWNDLLYRLIILLSKLLCAK